MAFCTGSRYCIYVCASTITIFRSSGVCNVAKGYSNVPQTVAMSISLGDVQCDIRLSLHEILLGIIERCRVLSGHTSTGDHALS